MPFKFVRRFNQISSFFGLNSAVFFSLCNRVLQAAYGSIIIFLIANWLSKEQQGYFYTFNSVVGLQVIFEMGLSFVMIQFSGHLFSKISWEKDGNLSGEYQSILKFHLLLRKAFTWYAIAALAMLLILMPTGIYFFSRHPVLNIKDWLYPWILLIVFTSLNLIIIPILSAIEGSGKIAEISKLRLLQTSIGGIISCGLLTSGCGLWMVVSIPVITFFSSLYWIFKYFSRLLQELKDLKNKTDHTLFSWSTELWPMQWRIAVSWISGYFIFQLFTPILFHFYGPIPAGRMGMSISLATMLNSFGFIWLQANSPKLTKIAAINDWNQFDKSFFELFKQSLFVILLSYGLLILGVLLIQNLEISQRILNPIQLFILLIGFLISHFINVLAYYLRLHKKEPFMILSLIGGFILAINLYIFGSLYAEMGMVISFLCVNLLYGLPSALWVWSNKRKEWHQLLN